MPILDSILIAHSRQHSYCPFWTAFLLPILDSILIAHSGQHSYCPFWTAFLLPILDSILIAHSGQPSYCFRHLKHLGEKPPGPHWTSGIAICNGNNRMTRVSLALIDLLASHNVVWAIWKAWSATIKDQIQSIVLATDTLDHKNDLHLSPIDGGVPGVKTPTYQYITI